MNDILQQKYSKQGKESFALGITGLLLHLLAFLSTSGFLLFELIALIAGISGLIPGIISRKKLKENNRFALAGVTVCILTLIGCVLSSLYFSFMISRIASAISAFAANPW